MKKNKNASVFTGCYCMSIVLVLIFLYGCAGPTRIQMPHPVSMVKTETEMVVWKWVENPETGVYEKRLVSKEHTETQTPVALKSGHSASKTDWEFYALAFFTMAVGIYIIFN